MLVQAFIDDPKDSRVTVTLTATLEELESLRHDLGPVPYYKVRALIEQIDDVSHKLRQQVAAAPQPSREMLPGDLGFLWSAQETRKVCEETGLHPIARQALKDHANVK